MRWLRRGSRLIGEKLRRGGSFRTKVGTGFDLQLSMLMQLAYSYSEITKSIYQGKSMRFAIIVLALLSASSPYAFGKSAGVDKNTAREFMHLMMEGPSAGEISFMLDAAGTTVDTKNAILDDLSTWGRKKFSGATIKSYAPLELQYRGATWTYDGKKPADTNYFAMKKFLEDHDHVSMLQVLFGEPAYAGAATNGAIFGADIAGVACIFAGPDCILTGLAYLAMVDGGMAGGIIGHESGNIAAAVKGAYHAIQSAKGHLVCDGQKATYSAAISGAAKAVVNKALQMIGKSHPTQAQCDQMEARVRKIAASGTSDRSSSGTAAPDGSESEK